MKRYCFTCDLKDDPDLIENYKLYHKTENVWPEITKSIYDAGVLNMQIYLTGNRLFMIMDTEEDFTLDRKAEMDSNNEKVQEWEKLMWTFQQALPWAKDGEKWVLMDKMFHLK